MKKLLFILVIFSILLLVSSGKKKKCRKCPSRDEKNVCCEIKKINVTKVVEKCKKCDAPTDANPQCRYNRKKDQYFCLFNITKTSTKTRCVCKCCDGWTLDSNNECTISINSTNHICQNGGTSHDNTCTCPVGFTGAQCETPSCDPPCSNNGICCGQDGVATCVCPTGMYTGSHCQIPICDPPCQNNGTCQADVYKPTCSCQPGYTGDQCEIKDEENPENNMCTYNGQYYHVCEIIQRGPCETCWCKDPTKQIETDQWECFTLPCFPLPCKHTKFIDGLCCPVCDMSTTTTRPTTWAPTTQTPTPRPTTQTPTPRPTTQTPTPRPTTQTPTPRPTTQTPTPRPTTQTPTPRPTTQTPTPRPTTQTPTPRPTTQTPTPRPTTQTPTPRPTTPTPTPRPTTQTPTPRPTTKRPTSRPTTPRSTCTDNGTEHQVGETIRNGSCEPCTCVYDGVQNHPVWRCLIIDCFRDPNCKNFRYIPGQCCPVCYTTTTTPTTTTTTTTTTTSKRPQITGPVFNECPRETIVLYTHHERFVDIRREVRLTVSDGHGKTYTVMYSKEIIYAKPCNCSDNIHIIIVRSEMDVYGRFATCIFTVHVFDNHPPVYDSCPAPIDALEDDTISWDEPQATDNIAVKSQKVESKFENNSKFKQGFYIVAYISTDHQGNVGICNFLVTIHRRESTYKEEVKSEDNEKKSMFSIIAGILAALFALTALLLVFACCRRTKCQKAPPPKGTSSFDNALYATPKTPPPSYGHSTKFILPPKYAVEDEKPPVYDAYGVCVITKKAVDNPAYDSSDEELEINRIKARLEMKEDTEA